MLGLWALLAVQGWAADGPEALVMPKRVTMSTPVWEDSAGQVQNCDCHRPVRSCLARFADWLCYHPGRASACAGCMCEPCCYPPAYAFFLHNCRCCTHDDGQGIPIHFSYTDLLNQCGDCSHHTTACSWNHCPICK
jgi:hypothetical protein